MFLDLANKVHVFFFKLVRLSWFSAYLMTTKSWSDLKSKAFLNPVSSSLQKVEMFGW